MENPIAETAGAGTERRGGRWSLRTMIFLLTGFMVTTAVAVAVALTWYEGSKIADEAVENAQARAASAADEFRSLRFRQIELMTEMLADDPPFSAYVSEATAVDLFGNSTPVDQTSLRDELSDRRVNLGFDIALALDQDGTLLAHSERPVERDETLTGVALVADVVENLIPRSGFLQEGQQVYQVAVVPMEVEFNLIGFVVTGLLVNNALVEEIKHVSGNDFIWLADEIPIASTLGADDTRTVLDDLGAENLLSQAADQTMSTNLTLSTGLWNARMDRVGGEDSNPIVGISLTSVDRVLAGYRDIRNMLIIAGIVVIAIALISSMLLARRVTGPLTSLVRTTQRLTKGHYDEDFRFSGGSSEVVEMADAFDSLLGELREKRDMERYVAELTRFLPDPNEAADRQTGSLEATRDERFLLAVEFRDTRDDAQEFDPQISLRTAEELGRKLSGICRAFDSSLELFAGQRAIFSVPGDRPQDTLGIASQIVAGLENKPSMALVKGSVSRATIRLEGNPHRALFGKPVLQSGLLLEEAPPGTVLLAPNLKELLDPILSDLKLELSVGQGRLSGRRYYSLGSDALMDIDTLTQTPQELGDADATQHTLRTLRANPILTPTSVSVGDLFGGRFEVVSIIGQGGMGRVYKAFDRELEDYVALKTLLPEIASDDKYLGQLKEEIKLARKITHPNVLRTYDFGSASGVPFISMEFVRGMTLRYLQEQGTKLPFSAALRVARQLCSGLAAAHEQGVIHRDVKPENLILEASGNAKLMDFGIASPMKKMNDTDGLFVGTPTYAAPEQMEGKALDASADVYACGVLMYELFCGVRMFDKKNIQEIYAAKLDEDFTPPDAMNSAIPHRLGSIIMRCLRTKRADRFGSAAELESLLDGIRV